MVGLKKDNDLKRDNIVGLNNDNDLKRDTILLD